MVNPLPSAGFFTQTNAGFDVSLEGEKAGETALFSSSLEKKK